MAVLMADRVDRPPTLFDFVEETPPVPAPAPQREAEETHELAPDATAGGVAHVHDGVGGEPTLDDMVVGAWEGLTAQAAVPCPLCDGTLRPLYAGAGGADPVVASRCDTCGTTLS